MEKQKDTREYTRILLQLLHHQQFQQRSHINRSKKIPDFFSHSVFLEDVDKVQRVECAYFQTTVKKLEFDLVSFKSFCNGQTISSKSPK